LRIALGRLFDVRPGEWRTSIVSFAVLFLTSAAYTVLETVRDTLLVNHVAAHQFGLAYIAVAAFALPVAGALARVARGVSSQVVLIGTLVASAAVALVFAGLSYYRESVVSLYVAAGLIASTAFPVFWVVQGASFTVSQSRRLLGPIASGSILGGAAGSLVAAALVRSMSMRSLLLLSAVMFLAAAAHASFLPASGEPPGAGPPRRTFGPAAAVGAFRDEPFLLRIALLVFVTTATALAIDYYFKWTIARTLPHAERGPFIARYYAVVNGVTLVVQIFLGSALLRRFGLLTAMLVTPLLLLFGGAVAFLAGAVALPALALKATDGSLRASIHRLTTELVYLRISPSGRERAKPFIDGALMRISQALTAGLLLSLTAWHPRSPRIFSAIVVALALTWLLSAAAIRMPYLRLLRRLVSPGRDRGGDPAPIDMAGAELLVEHLGSDDPTVALAAMETLARRGRQRLIPALVLAHSDARVLKRALTLFGQTLRTDWYSRAALLLDHPDQFVRMAAARALATHGRLDPGRLAADSAPSVRGYATLHAALADGPPILLDDPRIRALLTGDVQTRLGALAALADAPRSDRASPVLIALANEEAPAGESPYWSELLARATVRQGELAMIPSLIARLSTRAGRETIRAALVELGEPAFAAVAAALDDPAADRHLRAHLPHTLAAFGTKAASERLLAAIEGDRDRLIRYKAIRALGRLVSFGKVRVDRVRVEQSVVTNLATHLRLVALRVAIGPPPLTSERDRWNTYRLFAGLVDDKLRQSRERAFRLLKIAHPKEDIHRVYIASMSSDKRTRANAYELLDTLLRRRDQERVRELVKLVADDLAPEEQVRRAALIVGFSPPRTREQAVQLALVDSDVKLAALAALHAIATGDEHLEESVRRAQEGRPELAETAHVVFQHAIAV
jgi:ATP/ADP translocase/HEAT repeat protein